MCVCEKEKHTSSSSMHLNKGRQLPPGRAATFHTLNKSCSASRICVGQTGRSRAGVGCASVPGQCSS